MVLQMSGRGLRIHDAEGTKGMEILKWYASLMPELFRSQTGRNAIAGKLGEKLMAMDGANIYSAKIRVSESAENQRLEYIVHASGYEITVKKLKFNVLYDYVVDSHGIGLCFEDGSIVYVGIGDWEDFEVLK